jgi:hypothetical protein
MRRSVIYALGKIGVELQEKHFSGVDLDVDSPLRKELSTLY